MEKVGELMAVRLLKGQNRVVFDYYPPLLKGSLLFSSGAAAVFLLYAWWARRHPESSLRRIVLACGYRLFQCCAAVRAVKESPEGREIGQGLSAGGYWRGTISAGRSRFLFAGGRIGGKRLSVLKDG